MANTTLSQLTSIVGTNVAPTDSFLIYDVSANAEKQITSSELKNMIGDGPFVISSTDASDPALRITQTGTGNALVVEDSTSPDSSPFAIDAGGLVLVGTTSNQVDKFAIGNAKVQIMGGTAPLAFFRDADATTPINLEFAKRRATGGLLNNGDTIGRLYFSGNDGVNPIPAAFIDAGVDGTPGVNDMPGRLVFSTTPDGAAAPTEKMRISANGNVGIGTSTPSDLLHINGTNGELFRISVTSNASLQQTFGLGFATGSTSVHPATAIYTEEFDASDSRAALTFSTRDTNSDIAPTERMRIASDGNVGIGTSSPATSLHLVGSSIETLRIESTGVDTDPVLALTNDNGGASEWTLRLDHSDADNFQIRHNNSGRLTINTSGSVGIGTSAPNADAILQLDSTTQGFLPPRMTTTQRNAIASPVPAGLMIYNTTTNKLNFYNGTAWEAVTSA